MSICWFCHWGWPRPIGDIYDEAMRRLQTIGMCKETAENRMQFGPAHIVWSDENFDDSNIDYCIGECRPKAHWSDFSAEELDVIRWSLEQLRQVPVELRTVPPGYAEDDDRPDRHPPPPGVEMMRRP